MQALNFYQLDQNPVTPFGDHLGKENYNWTIPTLWTEIQQSADYTARVAAVKAYNKANRWTKKGIALVPSKYVMGIDYYSSGALVNIYPDGTVEVASGGASRRRNCHSAAPPPPLPVVGVSTWMERGRQQNDRTLADG